MAHSSRLSEIKHAQKESLLLRLISQFFMQILLDEKELQGFAVNRVKLSPDKGMCTVLFFASGGEQEFEEKKHLLILYKPSLRSALAKAINARYTPNLLFTYDVAFEKQRRINDIIDKLKDEGKL
jgi:ribosome-binding factor A